MLLVYGNMGTVIIKCDIETVPTIVKHAAPVIQIGRALPVCALAPKRKDASIYVDTVVPLAAFREWTRIRAD